MRHTISFVLNGSAVKVKVEDHWRLIDCLRASLNLTGTKEGCGEGECGACTVLIDGKAINSCLYPALEAEGKNIVTIEGLRGSENRLSPIQQAFVDSGAIQCGFCTPGMILAVKALLDSNADPSNREIRRTEVSQSASPNLRWRVSVGGAGDLAIRPTPDRWRGSFDTGRRCDRSPIHWWLHAPSADEHRLHQVLQPSQQIDRREISKRQLACLVSPSLRFR